ncbi:M16 family metallopeptidase [Novosphingopyxis iocasae]|uniref:M16 family metallopeptidase n=1 Tax=Novosphingopyxis iocasae TaxID=2762729 RepID=UPI0016513DBF|nr:M16 family metallopeptidase [Novosphingopyxis iocasae]
MTSTVKSRLLRSGALLPLALLAAQPIAAQTAEPAAPTTQQQPGAEDKVFVGQDGATGWGVPLTDVTPDPSITFGVLPNGMKYAIQQNDTPKDSASIRMAIDFGSIAETDEEQGLAHFIEHMAFNGSKNVPEGEMVSILERNGLAFGADTNASTGFEQTVYKLDLPKTDEKTVDIAMMLMREVAGNLTFDPGAVDRERGVIMGEMRARDSVGLRNVKDQLAFIAPDAPYASRLPIGTTDVLENAPASRLKALWQRYYRPENTTLVVVGDFDVQAMEAEIRERFGDWQGEGPAGAPLNFGSVDLNRATEVEVFTDPDVPYSASISNFRPWESPADTQAERTKSLIDALAIGAFNRRIERIASQPDSVIVGGGMSTNDLRDAALGTSVALTAKDGEWASALTTAEQEVRRAEQYGFTQAELDVQLANMETNFKTAAQQADTRRSPALANAILSTLDDDSFVTTPAYRLQLFEQVRPQLTLEAVNARFNALWDGSADLVRVTSKKPLTQSEQAVLDVYQSAQRAELTPPDDKAAAAFAYDDWGTPGKVVSDTLIEDLGIRQVRFANNVLLNFKKTDFEQNRVRYSVRVAGGQLAFPADEAGLGTFVSSIWPAAGLEAHSQPDLQEILAGKNVGMGLQVADDALVSSGSTTPADLDLQMKLSAAFLLDAGYRPEGDTQWTNIVPVFMGQVRSQPQGIAGLVVPKIVANNDARFGIPDQDVLLQRNLAEAKQVIEPLASSAPIEIAIVGDVDEDKAIAAVAQSFGALPKRELKAPDYSAARQASFAQDLSPRTLTHEGPADQAMLLDFWKTTDDSDYKREIVGSVAARAIDILMRDKLREELGATYGAQVSSSMSDVYKDFGTFSVAATLSPDRLDEAQTAIGEVLAKLRAEPIDDDLLLRARAPVIESIEKSRRENGFWLGVASEAQSRADRLERVREQLDQVKAVTPAEIQQFAQTYLTPNKMLPIRIVSSKLGADGGAAGTQ